MAGSALGGLLIAGLLIAWGLGRLVKPLADLDSDIAALRPDRGGQRVDVGPRASSALVVISDAVNDSLARNDLFVERERAFFARNRHESPPPVTASAGAIQLALVPPGHTPPRGVF